MQEDVGSHPAHGSYYFFIEIFICSLCLAFSTSIIVLSPWSNGYGSMLKCQRLQVQAYPVSWKFLLALDKNELLHCSDFLSLKELFHGI